MAGPIIIAGMIRSGSTWLYNAVRLLSDDGFEAAGWGGDLPQGDGRRLVKLHDPNEGWASSAERVFTTRRDLRDIAASLIAMGWDDDVMGAVDATVAAHDWWACRAPVETAYEAIVGDTTGSLTRIAEGLGQPAPAEKIAEVADALNSLPVPTEGGYDRQTLLHPNHRTDGRVGRWRDTLEPELASLIAERHSGWLERYGYL